MNRADALEDSPRRRTVGFALTVLQRRFASRTHAILRSLQRRRARLETTRPAILHGSALYLPEVSSVIDDYYDDELDSAEAEQLEDNVVDAATAARTAEELAAEGGRTDSLNRRKSCLRHVDRFRGRGSPAAALKRQAPLAHRLHRAPRHPRLPRRANSQRAGPRRSGGSDPWRHPPRRAPPHPGAIHRQGTGRPTFNENARRRQQNRRRVGKSGQNE